LQTLPTLWRRSGTIRMINEYYYVSKRFYSKIDYLEVCFRLYVWSIWVKYTNKAERRFGLFAIYFLFGCSQLIKLKYWL
jgi:hypothetical protein